MALQIQADFMLAVCPCLSGGVYVIEIVINNILGTGSALAASANMQMYN